MALWLESAIEFVRRWLKRSELPKPVDLANPLSSAASDAEVLLAYATQSRRGLDEATIKALTEQRAKVVDHLSGGAPLSPEDRAAFWFAYDKLAVAMAPLSAHSIRYSMHVNAQRMPRSMLSLPAALAAFSMVVFGACIALQSFWVTGSDLMEQVDKADKQRTDVNRQLLALDLAQRGTTMRSEALEVKLCKLGGACTRRAQPVTPPASAPAPTASGEAPATAAALASVRPTAEQVTARARLESQIEALATERDERTLKLDELLNEKERLNKLASPPTVLLRAWHRKLGKLCDWTIILRSVCISESAEVDTEFAAVDDTLKAAEQRLDSYVKQVEAPASAASGVPSIPRVFRAWYGVLAPEERRLKSEVDSARRQYALSVESLQRRVAYEVRINLGNLATYIIPLFMGLLGSLAFMMQSLTTQLKEHTHVPASISGTLVRLCLGAVAGVFGGLATPQSDAVLKALPPLFVPFVFGYGIEILFTLLNRIVGTFTEAKTGAKGM